MANPAETGFYYLQTRYYDPATSRFINADDTAYLGADGTPLSYNLFAYCMNNPVNDYDAEGNLSWKAKLAIAIGVVAVVAAVAAITVATAGTGTAIAAVAVGAAKGAAIGFATGAASGAVGGAIEHRMKTGSWEGVGEAILDGMATGALSGAISGAIMGGASGGANYLKARGFKIQEVGRLKPSNKPGNGNIGVKFKINKANGKPTIKSFEFHANHAHRGYKPHWQMNTWNPFNNSISSKSVHWTWWGKRI